MLNRILIFIFVYIVIFGQSVGGTMGERQDYKTEIKSKFNQIDFSDGISKEEAIIIAQNYLIYNVDNVYNLKSAEVIGENDPFWPKDSWHISFKVRSREWLSRGLKWGTFNVNKKTGKVTSGGGGPDL